MIEGPPASRAMVNRSISNHQARWLEAQARCFHCFLKMHVCKSTREGAPVCPFRGSGLGLVKGTHDGAPGWKPASQ